MSPRLSVIEIHKEELKFSAGHFMIFADSERESMHGHDYQVHAAFNTLIEHNGMAFDCRVYKQKLLKLCQGLDYRFLLPGQSDYLHLEDAGTTWIAAIRQEKIIFPKKDIVVLPLCNITLEELSFWFLQQLLQDPDALDKDNIFGIVIKVFNGRGESGATEWKK